MSKRFLQIRVVLSALVFMAVFALLLSPSGLLAGETDGTAKVVGLGSGQFESGRHKEVSGSVSKIESGMVFVKTTSGRRAISLSMANHHGLYTVHVGDELTLLVDEGNVAIDAYNKKYAPSPAHLFITGTLTYVSSDKKEMLLWTQEGEKPFAVEQGYSKFSVITVGTPITVELNDAGSVIDVQQAG
jgi:hypothetical protein